MSYKLNAITGALDLVDPVPQDLGTGDSPTFVGLTLSGLTQGSVLFAGAGGVISEDNGNLFWDDTNDFFGIGTATPGASLEINWTDTTDIGLIIQSPASQSANLIEFQNSSGTVFARVNSEFEFSNPTDSSGASNETFGVGALRSITSGEFNTAVGFEALNLNTTGGQNMAVGYRALKNNTTGSANMGIGSQTLLANTTASGNSAVGASYLKANTTGAENTGIGVNTLLTNQTGNDNSAVGNQALGKTTVSNGTAVGAWSLNNTSTGAENTALGAFAGRWNTTGSANVLIGYNTGLGSSGATVISNSVMIGTRAGTSILTNGDNNILIGYQCGDNLTTGASNLLIGYDIDAQSATASNQMSLGNLIFSEGIDGTGTTISSGKISIGIASASGKLHVDQPTTDAGIPVLYLDQADVSEEFIRFVGESTTDASQSLIDAANLTTPGSIVGWLRIYVEDVQGTGPITDGIYWVPFYTAPTA